MILRAAPSKIGAHSIKAGHGPVAGAAGCNRLTLENCNGIETGLDYEEVTRVIGPPDKCDDVVGLRSCTRNGGERSVSVTFAGGKVLLFSPSNLK